MKNVFAAAVLATLALTGASQAEVFKSAKAELVFLESVPAGSILRSNSVESILFNGITGDGQIPFGQVTFTGVEPAGVRAQPFLMKEGVFKGLPSSAGGNILAATPDGSLFTGFSTTAAGNPFDLTDAVYWTADGQIHTNTAPPGQYNFQVRQIAAVNDAGTLFGQNVFAYRTSPNLRRERIPYVHGLAGEQTRLGDLPTASFPTITTITAMTPDGKILVGDCNATAPGALSPLAVATIWEGPDYAPASLGLFSTYDQSFATGISADGRIIIGYAYATIFKPDPAHAVGLMWTNRQPVRISTEQGDWQPRAVSADGSVIVGGSSADSSFIWKPGVGAKRLTDFLAQQCNITVPGTIRLTEAVGISRDGSTIVGNSLFPSTRKGAWVLRLLGEAPRLSIALRDGKPVVKWNTGLTGFVLEFRATLPGSQWDKLADVDASTSEFSNLPTGSGYVRLRKGP